jgi:galactose-1-phosphate uridylyltransferase
MVVNFRVREINRGTCKQTRTLTLKKNLYWFYKTEYLTYTVTNNLTRNNKESTHVTN